MAWPDPDKYEGPHTAEGLLHSNQGLFESAQRRHAGHVANVHSRYASAIGLASRRGTRRTRYAPNDRLLKSLVFASVPSRLEFQHFLQLIYERYGFIVGHRQATDYVEHGQSDQKAFEDNARRLELAFSKPRTPEEAVRCVRLRGESVCQEESVNSLDLLGMTATAYLSRRIGADDLGEGTARFLLDRLPAAHVASISRRILLSADLASKIRLRIPRALGLGSRPARGHPHR